MKIKLGSIITEAKGVIGGTYVQKSNNGYTLARKRNSSGGTAYKLAAWQRHLSFANHNWGKITQSQRRNWVEVYGSQLKGFRQYVRQTVYRLRSGVALTNTVSINTPNAPLSITNITYTQATQSISITLSNNGAAAFFRIIEIKDYSETRYRKRHSGWSTLLSYQSSGSSTLDISTPIKARGWQVTNNSTFLLRVIQVNTTNDHEVTVLPTTRITTGA